MIDQQIKRLIRIRNPSDPLKYAHEMAKSMAYENLCKMIKTCQDCEISCGVKTLPSGRIDAPVMVISEAAVLPQQKESFSPARAASKEFSLFEAFLSRYGIHKDNLFFMNTVSCLPTRETESGDIVTRVPMAKEVKNCRVFVEYAIKIVQPKLIILLGAVALNLFKKEAISAERGKIFSVYNIPAVATYHPDYFDKIADKKDPNLIDELKIDFEQDLLSGINYYEKLYPDFKLMKK